MASAAFSLVLGIGGQLLSSLLKPKKKDSITFGSRISDLNVPTVSPGNEIPRVWGNMKIPTQFIYCSPLIETMHIAAQAVPGGKGGGKGGGSGGKKGGTTSYTISYTYAVNVAVGMCRGPVIQVNRIWAQSKLLWVNPIIVPFEQAAFDAAYESEGTRLLALGVPYEQAAASAWVFAYNNYESSGNLTAWSQVGAINYIVAHPLFPGASPNGFILSNEFQMLFSPVSLDKNYVPTLIRYDSLVVYLGDEFQEPDPTMQAALGATVVPAYRGLAYFVVNNLQLADFGNTVPTFQAEVVTSNGDVTLIDVLNGVLADSGIPADTYDTTTAIKGDTSFVGYAITQNVSTRQILTDLQKVFLFDGCESGYKIKFQDLVRRPTIIMDPSDFGAHIDTDEMPASIEQIRTSELDLPRRLNLKYQEKERNFSMNTVWSERWTGKSLSVEDVDVTLAMERASAQTQVEAMMVQRFLQRNTYKLKLPRKYIVLEPGDCVLVPDKFFPGSYQQWRCTEMAIGANGIIEASFCDSQYTVGDITAQVGTDIDVTPPLLPIASRTYAYLLDTPLLSDIIPDGLQFFAVISGISPGWKSGGLLVDLSDAGSVSAFGLSSTPPTQGSSWFSVVNSQSSTPHGFALTTLDPTVKPGTWDYKSVVHVLLLDNTWTLNNADPVDMMTQALNPCWINGELCAYSKAENLGNGNWKLTNWLRGLRGTEYAIPKHTGSEQFVQLTLESIKDVAQPLSALNKSATYVALTTGEVVGDEPTFTFTNTGNALRPFAPAITQSYLDDTGAFSLFWQPRNRINGGWNDGYDITLDQATEAYEIDVVTLDENNNDVVHITYTFGAIRDWTYAQAAQLADTGISGTGIYLNLYQMGLNIGRGFPSRVAI